jgi:hypothetical protein
MAIGENGWEPTPVKEVVVVSPVPVGDDNMIVPVTVRSLRKSPNEGIPTRLLRVLRPGTRLNPRSAVRVFYACTPFERYRDEGKPVLGHEDSCHVRGERDARDPLFDSLSVKERFRILSAAHTAEGYPR